MATGIDRRPILITPWNWPPSKTTTLIQEYGKYLLAGRVIANFVDGWKGAKFYLLPTMWRWHKRPCRLIAHLSDWLFTGVSAVELCLCLWVYRLNAVIKRLNNQSDEVGTRYTADAFVRRQLLKGRCCTYLQRHLLLRWWALIYIVHSGTGERIVWELLFRPCVRIDLYCCLRRFHGSIFMNCVWQDFLCRSHFHLRTPLSIAVNLHQSINQSIHRLIKKWQNAFWYKYEYNAIK